MTSQRQTTRPSDRCQQPVKYFSRPENKCQLSESFLKKYLLTLHLSVTVAQAYHSLSRTQFQRQVIRLQRSICLKYCNSRWLWSSEQGLRRPERHHINVCDHAYSMHASQWTSAHSAAAQVAICAVTASIVRFVSVRVLTAQWRI